MNEQLQLGIEARDRGMSLVMRSADELWCDRFDDAVAELARRHVPFTAAEVREMCGDPPGSPNVFGARLSAWARSGRIVHWGYEKSRRAERRASVVGVWVGA